MEKIDKAAERAVGRVTARSPNASVPAVQGESLPPAFVSLTDRDLPNRYWSSWRPDVGERELLRALAPTERSMVERRAADLRACLAPYGDGEIDLVCEAVATMLNSFPSLRGDAGAAAVARVDAAIRALEAFPAWAIVRGCDQIHRQGYELVERGGTRTERHWPPSDGDVIHVVEEMMKTRRDALTNAEAMLAAPVRAPAPPRPSEEDRTTQVESWRALHTMDDIDIAAEAARQKLEAERHARDLEERKAEWRRAGLEPPEPFVTLPLMLKMGWTIEEVGGHPTLVSPRKETVE